MRLYTDGSCVPNPGPGGWAVVAVEDDGRVAWTISGAEADTTNNRMELFAAIEAVRRAGADDVVLTDSVLVRNTLVDWLPKWRAAGWRRADGRPPANLDLLQRASALDRRASVEWVKAHAGIEGNELADRAANAARSQLQEDVRTDGRDPPKLPGA